MDLATSELKSGGGGGGGTMPKPPSREKCYVLKCSGWHCADVWMQLHCSNNTGVLMAMVTLIASQSMETLVYFLGMVVLEAWCLIP